MKGGFYYAPRDAISGTGIVLPSDESRHAIKVMRLSPGSEIQVVDGQGRWYLATIVDVRRGVVTATIVRSEDDVGEPSYELTIALGLLRNAGRFETFLEKAVELGVSRVIPLETDRTQTDRLNRNRCERVMIAGLKQSMRSRLPSVNDIQSFEKVVGASVQGVVRLVAHEMASASDSLLASSDLIKSADRVVILIGPEGGFTDTEIELAKENGWKQVSLGESRLRTETAAIAAAGAIHMIKSR
jgi:16S rRNA (uracil1498-N3)-methyltransferase